MVAGVHCFVVDSRSKSNSNAIELIDIANAARFKPSNMDFSTDCILLLPCILSVF